MRNLALLALRSTGHTLERVQGAFGRQSWESTKELARSTSLCEDPWKEVLGSRSFTSTQPRTNVLEPFGSQEQFLSWMYYIGPDAQAGAS